MDKSHSSMARVIHLNKDTLPSKEDNLHNKEAMPEEDMTMDMGMENRGFSRLTWNMRRST